MGKVWSVVLANPFRNFNVESRAHKVISQNKPAPAPKHKSAQIDLERLMKEYPKTYEESLKKNQDLDKHLKSVFVTSTDVIPEQKIQNPDRPLPLDRKTPGLFLYGMREPEKIPLGRTTLRQLLEFITRHQSDPRNYTAEKIAADLLVPEEKIKNVLKYFRVFEIYIPQERDVKAKFAGPSLPKIQIIKDLRKTLPAPNTETKEKT